MPGGKPTGRGVLRKLSIYDLYDITGLLCCGCTYREIMRKHKIQNSEAFAAAMQIVFGLPKYARGGSKKYGPQRRKFAGVLRQNFVRYTYHLGVTNERSSDGIRRNHISKLRAFGDGDSGGAAKGGCEVLRLRVHRKQGALRVRACGAAGVCSQGGN
jgi:hypothetical protein